MSRKTPTILDHARSDKLLHVVTDCEAVFAVYRGNQPINYQQHGREGSVPHYRRTVWVTEGSARLLARKLNALFNTDKYRVVRMVPAPDA